MQQSMIRVDQELDLARNMLGGRLSDKIKKNIQAYINAPTPDGWDEIKGYIIHPTGRVMTIWQCIIEIDPTFPRVGRSTDENDNVIREWTRIPDAELIRQALAYATH